MIPLYKDSVALVAAEGITHSWRTESGYKGLLLRCRGTLHWCVYIEVPKSHPDFGVRHDSLRSSDRSAYYGAAEDAAMHGQISHSGPMGRPALKRFGMRRRRPMRWVFGADFAHYNHYLPGYPDSNRWGHYVNKRDAIWHGESIAEDLLARKSLPVPLDPLAFLTRRPVRPRPWISLGRGVKARSSR